MVAPGVAQVGAQLDEHHPPETNGRMAVCRRCGAKTDNPAGGSHQPDERRLTRSTEWLDAQLRMRHIDRARQVLRR